MAESVDALVSNTSGATRAGSTPALGTGFKAKVLQNISLQHFFHSSYMTISSDTATRYLADDIQHIVFERPRLFWRHLIGIVFHLPIHSFRSRSGIFSMA